MKQVQIRLDAVEQIVANHIVGQFDRRGETIRIGSAVALHNDPVQPQENATIRAPDIHLFTQAVESALGEDVADPGHQGAAHRGAQITRYLARRSFGRLQGDIAGEALRHHNVDRALADIVAFDKAMPWKYGYLSPLAAKNFRSFE